MSDAMVASVDPNEGDVTDVVEDMQKANTARTSGTYSLNALLGDDAPPPPEPAEAPDYEALGLQAIVTNSTALIEARPAETVDSVRQARPGLTPRGWSPEVTARHPQLVAATVEELAGTAAGGTAESVDPNDSAALTHALAALGSKDVMKTILYNAAVKLNYRRLTSGMAESGFSSPAAQAAFAELVAQLQGSGEAAETETTAPTTAPTTTRTRTRTTATATEPAPVPPPPPAP